jgi:LPS export ABC transporter protein LptC
MKVCLPGAWVLACCLLTGACVNDIEEVEELVAQYDAEVETAYDVEILYSDSARVMVRITGPKLLFYLDAKDPRQEFPDFVKVEFFDRQQQVTSTLTAKYGLRYAKRDLVIARDSVVLLSEDGNRLETEELIWSDREDRIYTDHFVVIQRPGEILYGRGFEATEDFTQWRILAPEGHILVDKRQPEAGGAPPSLD